MLINNTNIIIADHWYYIVNQSLTFRVTIVNLFKLVTAKLRNDGQIAETKQSRSFNLIVSRELMISRDELITRPVLNQYGNIMAVVIYINAADNALNK